MRNNRFCIPFQTSRYEYVVIHLRLFYLKMDPVLVSSISLIALDSWYMRIYFCCSESSFSHDTARDLQKISGDNTSKVGHLSMKEVRIVDLAIFSTMLLKFLRYCYSECSYFCNVLVTFYPLKFWVVQVCFFQALNYVCKQGFWICT